ncbi:hypothetical protein ACJX0J_032936, partial [Zea mays]
MERNSLAIQFLLGNPRELSGIESALMVLYNLHTTGMHAINLLLGLVNERASWRSSGL